MVTGHLISDNTKNKKKMLNLKYIKFIFKFQSNIVMQIYAWMPIHILQIQKYVSWYCVDDISQSKKKEETKWNE